MRVLAISWIGDAGRHAGRRAPFDDAVASQCGRVVVGGTSILRCNVGSVNCRAVLCSHCHIIPSSFIAHGCVAVPLCVCAVAALRCADVPCPSSRPHTVASSRGYVALVAGTSICEHQRQKHRCKDCGATQPAHVAASMVQQSCRARIASVATRNGDYST